MQRLSGLDASFLYLETSSQPMHVCSLMELDTATMPGGYTFDRLREALLLRIKAMPEFREKLANSPLNLDHPVWVDDENFEIDRHFHRIGLPAPGGRAEFSEICGHIASLPLDRRRPLWEMWVIEGVAGTDCHRRDGIGGRIGLMTKVHHAGVDGVTGAALMSQLCATEPDAPAPDPVDGVGGASGWQIAAGGLLRFATRPLNLATLVPDTVSTVVGTLLRARDGLTMARPFTAPRTVFNNSISGRRNIAYAQIDFEDIKTVKNRFDVKVNDVVMALVSGVLRQFLADRNELPDSSLVATVPVSVHGKSDRPGRNQVSGMFASLDHRRHAVAGLDAVRRARRVRRRDAGVRQESVDREPARAQLGGFQCAGSTGPAVPARL
jgi:diacylglycerol O-acyltransferase